MQGYPPQQPTPPPGTYTQYPQQPPPGYQFQPPQGPYMPQQPVYQQPPQGYQFQPPQGPYMPQQAVYQQPPKKSRRGLWIALAVVLVVVVVLCGIVGMATSSATQTGATTSNSTGSQSSGAPASTGKWTTTHSYSGNGAKKTETITVPDDWKLAYTCQGMNIDGMTATANLQVYVYGSDGSMQDVAINETCDSGKTTSGTTEEHQGGQVYLDVNADSNWTLKVEELK